MYTVIIGGMDQGSFLWRCSSKAKLNGYFHLRVTLSNRDWFVESTVREGLTVGFFPPCDELMERHSSLLSFSLLH